MCREWIYNGGWWYYLKPASNTPNVGAGSEGSMCKGWIKDGEYWYYLRPATNISSAGAEGSMLVNTRTLIDGKIYIFNASGQCVNPY